MRCRAAFSRSQLLALLTLLVLPAALGAQRPAAGERVRVSYRPVGHTIGTLRTWSGDTLVVQGEGAGLEIRIPLDSLTVMEVSGGRTTARAGRLVGALVAGAVAFTWLDKCGEGRDGCSTLSGVAGVLTGVVVGGFFGSLIRQESWRRIELDGLRSQAGERRTR